jgi:hypothetical protein
MRISAIIAAAGALALAPLVDPGAARAHAPHHAKHRSVRTSLVPRYGPAIELPPGYSQGGPNYTTCDRINHDRMLVGTCR